MLVGRRWALVALLLLYMLPALLYTFLTPLGEGPDEPGHAAYVFFLAREGRLPVQCQDPCVSDVPGEGHQPPLAYALAVPAVLWLPPEQRVFEQPGNRNFVWAGGDQVHAVAHGSREYWPWQGAVLGWHLARLVSVWLGALTVLFTWLAAAVFVPRLAWLAAALVALNPQFLFSSALISNDPLLTTLSAALLWLVLRPVSGMAYGRALLLGLLLGLALITKQSALLLVPLLGLWCFHGVWWGQRTQREAARRMLLMVGSRFGLIMLVAGLVSGWWYARNLQLYGDLFGLALFRAEFTTQPFAWQKPDAWLAALAQLYESFWGRFGWMNIPAPDWMNTIYLALGVLALLGWIVGLVRRSQDVRDARWLLLLALTALALVWVVAFAFTAGLVAWQGRLLFPALSALAILLAAGLQSLGALPQLAGSESSRWRRVVVAVPLVGLFILAVWTPFGVIRPAYPFYTLAPAAAADWPGAAAFARFARYDEPGAAIVRWRMQGEQRPGGTITLDLLWHALSAQNRNWMIFVHVRGPEDVILAEDNREPADGRFPMLQWVPGDWVATSHPITLPPDLAPGTYTVAVGLWDPRTGRMAQHYNQNDRKRGNAVRLTTITVP